MSIVAIYNVLHPDQIHTQLRGMEEGALLFPTCYEGVFSNLLKQTKSLLTTVRIKNPEQKRRRQTDNR